MISYEKCRPYFIHAISPIHPGVGQGAGVVDLPVAREKATRLPIIPGSSVKGVKRAMQWAAAANDQVKRKKVIGAYGPESDKSSDHAGAVSFSDARLLLLPVRSLRGVFAWVGSPLGLKRLLRDLEQAGITSLPSANMDLGDATALLPDGVASAIVDSNKIYLEELDIDARVSPEVKVWGESLAKWIFPADWREEFQKRFLIVKEEIFDFLHETALEVSARIRIDDEKKTVAKGALWYEEALPAESVLWGLAVGEKPYNGGCGLDSAEAVLDYVLPVGEEVIRLGGKSTVGRGRARMVAVR